MDKNGRTRAVNPRQRANFLSAIFFKWILKTFFTGYKRELSEADLYQPLDEHSSNFLGHKIYRLWDEEQERCQKLNVKSMPSLLKVIVKCFAFDIAILGLFTAVLELGIRTSQPLIFANLLKYFSEEKRIDRTEAIYWGSALVASLFFNCIFFHSLCQGLTHLGMKARVACSALIYRKILRVPQVSLEGQASVGQMINFLKNEANRLDKSFLKLHYIWVAPVQIWIISYLLYREISIVAAAGVVVLKLFMPIYGCYGKLFSRLAFELVYGTEERLKLTNEIINNIKFVKMYAWEEPFLKLIAKARDKEIHILKNSAMASQICLFLKTFIPRFFLFGTILMFIVSEKSIKAENIYLLIAYYNILQSVLCQDFPTGVQDLAEFSTIINRIKEFLLLEEIDKKSLTNNQTIDRNPTKNVAISLENVSAKWNARSKSSVLSNVTLCIRTGNLTAIIGARGSGKTTLFHAILNELPSISGKVKARGSVSYASQQPWIFASSIKANITFGQPINRTRYERVVNVCQLKRDFLLLAYGDNTLVGEKGMDLSRSQRARIHLARALYHEADIYLLDDPLAALDPQIGRAVRTFLRGKTVLLATHEFHYTKYTDRIIVLEEGRVKAEGSYAELLDHSELDCIDCPKLGELAQERETPLQPFSEGDQERLENRQFESITAKSYKRYFGAASSSALVLLVFLASLTCQAFSTAADYLVAHWVNVEVRSENVTVISDDDDLLRGRSWFVHAYGYVNLFVVLFVILQNLCFYNVCTRISRRIHARMVDGVAYTTMDFFNSNPIGRVMNRFAKDMGTIDTRIPSTLNDVIRIGMCVLAVNVIVVSINPWLIIPAIITFLIFYILRLFYIKTIRSIRRLEGMTRSPMLSHLCTSTQGLTTIRALGAEKSVTKELDNYQDLHSSVWYLQFSASQALGLYVELCSVVFSATVVYTLLLSNELASPGYVGLAISQCMIFVSLAQWGVRQSSELTSHMISLERVLDYARLPPEESAEEARRPAPTDWPRHGCIVFENVSLAYDRRDRPSLRNLSVTLEPGEKVAVVGRGDADKCALIDALLRLQAGVEGSLRIDGLSVGDVGLRELRSNIGVLPREPALLPGTLRDNLDPFGLWLDHNLWQALEDVGLKNLLDLSQGLETKMLPDVASRFGTSQRRLMCLARAILRGNRILVIEEAGVDPHADELVHEVVRRKFIGCTVLVVAQRLGLVMDSDKILVMDSAEVVEFDHPFKLLQKENGVFYNMIQQLGSSSAANLFEIAKFNYNKETARL